MGRQNQIETRLKQVLNPSYGIVVYLSVEVYLFSDEPALRNFFQQKGGIIIGTGGLVKRLKFLVEFLSDIAELIHSLLWIDSSWHELEKIVDVSAS